MKTLEIKLEIKPIAKGRPRMGKFGAYTPAKTRKAEDSIKKQIKALSNNIFFTGPVQLELVFNFAPNKSDSKKIRKEKESGKLPMIKKPDLDNLIKLVKDCFKGIVLNDDSQIIKIIALKNYSAKDSVLIKLSEII